jgi:hypothetical protein
MCSLDPNSLLWNGVQGTLGTDFARYVPDTESPTIPTDITSSSTAGQDQPSVEAGPAFLVLGMATGVEAASALVNWVEAIRAPAAATAAGKLTSIGSKDHFRGGKLACNC